MALYTTQQPAVETTGATSIQARPVNPGVTVQATEQNDTSGAGGMFDWLDDLGTTVGGVFNNAVETVGNNWVEGLDETNPGGVTVVDTAAVPSDNKMPVSTSWMADNQQMLMIGGAALLGLGVLYMATRK